MSIRLRSESGRHEVTNQEFVIDKNWGEIEKKYWTVSGRSFTFKTDRLYEVIHGRTIRDHSFIWPLRID